MVNIHKVIGKIPFKPKRGVVEGPEGPPGYIGKMEPVGSKGDIGARGEKGDKGDFGGVHEVVQVQEVCKVLKGYVELLVSNVLLECKDRLVQLVYKANVD